MDTKRSVFVLLLAAVLLSSLMVGMASAAGTQTWYLTDTSSGLPTGANYEMHKGSGEGSDIIGLSTGNSLIWVADEYVTVNQIDISGSWPVSIRFQVSGGAEVKLKVEIGKLSGGDFTSYGVAEKVSGAGSMVRDWQDTVSTDGFSISENEYLAIQVTNTGTNGINVLTKKAEPPSPSYINSPSSDPGYPVPELPTILLTGIGLLALTGFVLYSRVCKRKRI